MPVLVELTKSYATGVWKYKKLLSGVSFVSAVGVVAGALAMFTKWPDAIEQARPLIPPWWLSVIVWLAVFTWVQFRVWCDQYKVHKTEKESLSEKLKTSEQFRENQSNQIEQLQREIAAEKDRNREPVVRIGFIEGQMVLHNDAGFDVFSVVLGRLVRAGHVLDWRIIRVIRPGAFAAARWGVCKGDASGDYWNEPLKTFAARGSKLADPVLELVVRYQCRNKQWQSLWDLTFNEDTIRIDHAGVREEPPPISQSREFYG